jgi:hypothetical protein
LISVGIKPVIEINAICSELSPTFVTIYYEDTTVFYDDATPSSNDVFSFDRNSSVSSLTVRGNLVDNQVWKMISKMSGLESIDISVCPNVTTIPAEIGNLKRLRSFEAFGCSIDDRSFCVLASECRVLEHIDCGSTLIGNRGFRALCGIESLRSLLARWSQISQEGINGVKNARKLEHLAISNTAVETLRPISECLSIRSLDATGILIDRDAVDALVQLESLECLSISLNEFNIALLERLMRECPSLRQVCVSGIFISDSDAAPFHAIRLDVKLEIGLDSCECWKSE